MAYALEKQEDLKHILTSRSEKKRIRHTTIFRHTGGLSETRNGTISQIRAWIASDD